MCIVYFIFIRISYCYIRLYVNLLCIDNIDLKQFNTNKVHDIHLNGKIEYCTDSVQGFTECLVLEVNLIYFFYKELFFKERICRRPKI